MKHIKINGIKYIPNVDAFKVRNKWTVKEQVSKDTFTNQYDLTTNLTPYIDLNNILKYSSKLVNIELPNEVVVPICKSVADSIKYNLIPHPTDSGKYILLGLQYKFGLFNRFQPTKKVYSVTESNDKLSPYTSLENGLDFLKEYTYGIELETVGIPLNKKEVNSLGFYELYDGSITGPEYATGILKYDNLHHVEHFLKLLKTISRHDHTCSLHIHIGNIKYTPDRLSSIYSLFQRLQEDLNLLIAPYKKDYKFLYNKQKDHCQNLPLIPSINEKEIRELFRVPSSSPSSLVEYITRSSKWNLIGRYYTVNFLNYICKPYPNNTIECRSLQMTFNYDYALTWLIINTSIIHFAIHNSKLILDKKEKLQVEDCLTFLIKDSTLLDKVLSNYYKIKNTIYSKKYLDGDTNTNSMVLDEYLRNLTPITTPLTDTNNTIVNSILNIDQKKVQQLKTTITTSHVDLGSVNLRLSGNYSFPSGGDTVSILQHIVSALESSKKILDSDKKYYIKGTDIVCGSTRMYRDPKIEHTMFIEDGTAYYKVEFGPHTVLKSMSCKHLYKNGVQEIIDSLPWLATSSVDEPQEGEEE